MFVLQRARPDAALPLVDAARLREHMPVVLILRSVVDYSQLVVDSLSRIILIMSSMLSWKQFDSSPSCEVATALRRGPWIATSTIVGTNL